MAAGSSNDFDLVVLGAGTGGYSAAFRAAQLGLRVALVDEDKIGGTCLHRGCIPTKALLESAEMVNRARHLKDYGVVVGGEPSIDYATIAQRRDQVVKRLWTGLKTLIDKNKVAWIQGRGRLDGPGRVRVLQAGEDGTPGAGGERVLRATWRQLADFHAVLAINTARLPPEELHRRHVPMLDQLEPLIERGQEKGVFRRDLSVTWLLAVIRAIVHAASREVQGGRLAEPQAEDVLLSTALAAISERAAPL